MRNHPSDDVPKNPLTFVASIRIRALKKEKLVGCSSATVVRIYATWLKYGEITRKWQDVKCPCFIKYCWRLEDCPSVKQDRLRSVTDLMAE